MNFVASSIANNAPTGTDKTLSLDEDTSVVITAADLGFSDVDGNNLQSVTITTLPTAGTLTLNGVAVTAGQVVTLAQLNANQLVFTPAANANGTGYANLTFQVTDDGGTANNGQNTDQSPNTLTFDVASVNDAPSGTDKTLSLNEDGGLAITAADLGFSDVDGNNLQSVTITTLPTAGMLTLNGVAVTAGQVVTLAQLNANQLVFAPAPDANGIGYASLTFQVTDDGGTANGGQNTDPTPNTLTFNVTAVNDAPVVTIAAPGGASAPSGGETLVNTTTALSQRDPSVTGLADGGFVISWMSFGQDGSGWGIYAQRYDAAGGKVGGETLVNTTTESDQMWPSVAALTDGGFVVSWMSPDGSGWGVYAQRYDAAGAKVGAETLVNTTTAESQQDPSVAGLADGGFVISWMSSDGNSFGIYAQRYDAAGAKVGAESLVNTTRRTANSIHQCPGWLMADM